jgi:hypothetical protein
MNIGLAAGSVSSKPRPLRVGYMGMEIGRSFETAKEYASDTRWRAD